MISKRSTSNNSFPDCDLHSGFGQLVLLTILIPVLFNGCKKEKVPEIYYPRSDHEAYLHSLEEVNLHETALGIEWIKAAERSLAEPITISLPFQEVFYLDPKIPDAAGYHFFVKRGLRIEMEVSLHSSDSLLLFADLYRETGDSIRRWIHVATASKDKYRLEFEPRRDAFYILRLQPELLRGGRLSVLIREVPSLAFPVQGKNSRSIQSFFGDVRDGGRREHHGVDIFASRHTPVTAPSRSQVLRIGEGEIGGRYVWLYDSKRSMYLYFAHLETQQAEPHTWVIQGDVIGTVGNSGNARRTRPHLHFGIYQNGPVDPFHFIAETEITPDKILADTHLIGEMVRLKEPSSFRSGPGPVYHYTDTLEKHSIIYITGATGRMYRILLPDGRSGYIRESRIELTDETLQQETFSRTFALLDSPSENAITMKNIGRGDEFHVLGKFKNYIYGRTREGRTGWIRFL